MLFLIFLIPFVVLNTYSHMRSNLMLCLFAINAFMCDLYFVFIASICLVFFNTIITFYRISAHFFNMFIFVTIETLNYFTISSKHHRVFFAIS